MPKTAEELQQENNELESEIKMRRVLDIERKESNQLYATKIVERIVFGLITVILLAVMAAIIKNLAGL